MKFVIRKIPERNTSKLESILPDALIYSDEQHVGALDSFCGALRLADDDAVYIQDDMILGRDFRKKALQYIQKYSNSVIVFSNNQELKTMTTSEEGWYPADQACWLLCTYIPKRIADAYLYEVDSGIWKRSQKVVKSQLDDLDFLYWMKKHGEDVFLVVPNIAGHPHNKSSIVLSRGKRLSSTFDYFDVEYPFVGGYRNDQIV